MATSLAKIIADFNTQMATKNAVGDTTGTIQGYTDDDGVALPAGVYYFTVDGESSVKEFIQATLGVAGALTSIKNVSRQGVLTSGFARVHRVGATVEITDFAHIKMMLDLLDATTGFNASAPIKYDGASTPTLGQYHIPSWDYVKAYADGLAIAGAPDASTTVKGIGKTSVAPASATNPIFVGDNDPRVPTQNENDALVGTSGTAVSSSNKLVDADDVAENTNSKIVRRKSNGNVTVPTTPSASTDASSKSYTDTGDAAVTALIPNQNNLPNVNPSFGTYFTQVIPVDADLGWTVVGTPTNRGNWYEVANAANARAFTTLGGLSNNDGSALLVGSGIDVKIAYLFTPSVASDGTTAFAGTDTWFYHGFNYQSEAASVPADITGLTDRIGFAHYNGRIYAITSTTTGGGGVTATDIQADSVAKRHFMIDFTPSSVRFYINGTLVATHTTNIPSDSGANLGLFFGGSDSAAAEASFGMSATVIISETLS